MEFFVSQSKNAIFASLHVSNKFETCAAYPYTAGHFELIEVPSSRSVLAVQLFGDERGAADEGDTPLH